MAIKYTKEQLNKLDKETIIQMFLSQQEHLENIDSTIQLRSKIPDLKRHRFESSSEIYETEDQISFMEVNENIVLFNESEAVYAEKSTEDPKVISRRKPRKKRGKREKDPEYPEDPPVVVVEHSLTEEEPEILIRDSLVSPSLEAAVMNAKYVNVVSLFRQQQEFERYGLHISRQDMANWTIQCADRYLTILYDYLHKKMYDCHVLQADEIPMLENKDGRVIESKSYMWVYRTGQMYTDRQIVLYEFQKTRNAIHPREFLKDFSGICVTDGFQVYHTVENEWEDLRIAGCWSHVKRYFNEAVEALPKAYQKDSRAYLALTMIQAIYQEEKKLKELPAQERQTHRQLVIRPLVEAYFLWIRETLPKIPKKNKTWEGFNYSLNQERYLKVFLDDGEVPMDNNAAEQSIRGFCIGNKNWVIIDTSAGVKSSAVIYSIAETAKANGLKPYDYFEYLLTEIPKHLNDIDQTFLDDLLPWSPDLPENCCKLDKNEVE